MASYALFVIAASKSWSLTFLACDIVDLECWNNWEEFLSLIFFEYFFFGFFWIPILKMLLQTYDWIEVDDEMVLRREPEWSKFFK